MYNKIPMDDKTQCPAPRNGHACCCYEGKVYLFGGNGGRGYENSIFKDLWCFDPVEGKWEEIINLKQNNYM